jgi:hypothetical protein
MFIALPLTGLETLVIDSGESMLHKNARPENFPGSRLVGSRRESKFEGRSQRRNGKNDNMERTSSFTQTTIPRVVPRNVLKERPMKVTV